jgi:hypothetical protein
MVGNCHYVQIWEDRWLPNQNKYKIISSQPGNTNVVHLKDLIKDDASSWNNDIIDQNFTPFEGEQIKQLPIIIGPHKDQLMWMHSRDGHYTIKTGYNAIHQ